MSSPGFILPIFEVVVQMLGWKASGGRGPERRGCGFDIQSVFVLFITLVTSAKHTMDTGFPFISADFAALLRAFDPDPEMAGLSYEATRRRLIVYFNAYGCQTPEELADLTFDRLARKIESFVPNGAGSLNAFIYGIARNIKREHFAKVSRYRLVDESFLPEIGVAADAVETVIDQRLECLNRCVDALNEEDRSTLLDYYRLDGIEKIKLRKQISARLGISLNNLHTKVYRIRARIGKGVRECLEKK